VRKHVAHRDGAPHAYLTLGLWRSGGRGLRAGDALGELDTGRDGVDTRYLRCYIPVEHAPGRHLLRALSPTRGGGAGSKSGRVRRRPSCHRHATGAGARGPPGGAAGEPLRRASCLPAAFAPGGLGDAPRLLIERDHLVLSLQMDLQDVLHVGAGLQIW